MGDERWVTQEEYESGARRFSELMDEFERLPYPDVREKVFELLQSVDVIHRAGLTRLAAFLSGAGQEELLERAAQDEMVQTLLELYDLLPDDGLAQAERALEVIRPYIRSHGGEVEVLDVDDGLVHLRLAGACHGCAGSAMTLRRGIEAALKEGFPGFKGVQVHDSVPATAPVGFMAGVPFAPGGVIPLMPANANGRHAAPLQPAPQRPIFLQAVRADQVPAGEFVTVDLERVRVLIANVEGEIYAVRNNCPCSTAPLDLGAFTPPVLVCPWHNEPYDVRTGQRVDGVKEPRLQVLPVAIVDGAIRVAVNVVPAAG